MHLLGARTDEDVQEQLNAKREMPQWDSEEEDAAEKEVSMNNWLTLDILQMH